QLLGRRYGDDADALRGVAAGTFVLDAAIGALTPDAQEVARGRGAQLVRIDIWPQLGAAIEAAHASARVREQSLGWSELAGVPVVSGGAMGRAGDVVVDSVHHPTRVIAVADGRGGVIFEPWSAEHGNRVRAVREEIYRRLIAPSFDTQ
ncbi:MAG TPA: hypothetical protein VN181_16025, partial [Thermoanaerobaculia bacterium]|nr:hypothetical protein [Thermoanaerobaculia bacterium]